MDGIINSFKLADIGTNFAEVNMQNYKSATNPSPKPIVEQTICDEISQGNYIISATKPTVVNALGAIPKPNSSEVRLIYDCSPPHGQAVKLLGPNYFMAILWLKNKRRRKLKNEKMYVG